jgi:hypothetical protein
MQRKEAVMELKKPVVVGAVLMSILSGVATYAQAASDGQKAATKTAVTVTRQAVGPMIGGTTGKIITGGPIGAGLGVILTPSEISKDQDLKPGQSPNRPKRK